MSDLSKQEIRKLITSEYPLMFDIGCHDGNDAAELAELFDRCLMHCFEADIRICDLFLQKHRMNCKLELHQLAVGAEYGFVEFYQSSGRNKASGSIKKPKEHLELFPDVTFENDNKVIVIPLDLFYKNLNNAKVDFIWCDINGAEKDFIIGAEITLKHTKYLYIEFEEKELYEGSGNRQELISMLPAFELVGEYNFEGNFGNLLFKNKNII